MYLNSNNSKSILEKNCEKLLKPLSHKSTHYVLCIYRLSIKFVIDKVIANLLPCRTSCKSLKYKYK